MLRKFFAGFFATVFIMTLTPLMFLVGTYNVLAEKSFYTEDFADESYDFLLNSVPSFLENEEFKSLTGVEANKILVGTLSEDDYSLALGEIYDSVSSSVFRDSALDVVIPLEWLLNRKEVLAKELSEFLYDEREDAAMAKIDYQAKLSQDLANGVFSGIPSELHLTTSVPKNLEGLMVDYFAYIFMLFVAAIALFLFAVLIIEALFVYKSGEGVLKVGFKTLFLGALFFSITLIVLLISSNLILANLGSTFDGNGELVLVVFYGLFVAVLFKSLFYKFFILSLVFVLVTLGGWITLKKHNDKLGGNGGVKQED